MSCAELGHVWVFQRCEPAYCDRCKLRRSVYDARARNALRLAARTLSRHMRPRP